MSGTHCGHADAVWVLYFPSLSISFLFHFHGIVPSSLGNIKISIYIPPRPNRSEGGRHIDMISFVHTSYLGISVGPHHHHYPSRPITGRYYCRPPQICAAGGIETRQQRINFEWGARCTHCELASSLSSPWIIHPVQPDRTGSNGRGVGGGGGGAERELRGARWQAVDGKPCRHRLIIYAYLRLRTSKLRRAQLGIWTQILHIWWLRLTRCGMWLEWC